MTKCLPVLFFALLLAACGRTPNSSAKSGLEPFPGVDLSKLSARDRQVVSEAAEDFQAVLAGKRPVHAVFDKDAPLPSDGGTTFYKGSHYQLTATITRMSLGGFDGIAFGPRLKFDESFAPGFNQEISSIRVYSREQLAARLHGL